MSTLLSAHTLCATSTPTTIRSHDKPQKCLCYRRLAQRCICTFRCGAALSLVSIETVARCAASLRSPGHAAIRRAQPAPGAAPSASHVLRLHVHHRRIGLKQDSRIVVCYKERSRKLRCSRPPFSIICDAVGHEHSIGRRIALAACW